MVQGSIQRDCCCLPHGMQVMLAHTCVFTSFILWALLRLCLEHMLSHSLQVQHTLTNKSANYLTHLHAFFMCWNAENILVALISEYQACHMVVHAWG